MLRVANALRRPPRRAARAAITAVVGAVRLHRAILAGPPTDGNGHGPVPRSVVTFAGFGGGSASESQLYESPEIVDYADFAEVTQHQVLGELFAISTSSSAPVVARLSRAPPTAAFERVCECVSVSETITGRQARRGSNPPLSANEAGNRRGKRFPATVHGAISASQDRMIRPDECRVAALPISDSYPMIFGRVANAARFRLITRPRGDADAVRPVYSVDRAREDTAAA
jgi:hypothetical protein